VSPCVSHSRATPTWKGKTRTLDGTEDELVNELLLKVLDNHALSTQSQGLLLDRSPVLFLADIGKEALKGELNQ
jgi:hypothetical protein